MKIIFYILYIFFIVFLFSFRLQAQTINHQKKISFTVFDEHIATPFEVKKDAPSHFGATLAYERSRLRESIYQYTHIFQLGYYYHNDFNQVAFLAWKPKFELRFANTFNVNLIVGLGYAHSFPVRQAYELENGSYKKKTSFGKPHGMPSIGFGAGLHLDKWFHIPIEIFGRYEVFSLAPYALKGKVPLTINTMLSLGVKVNYKNRIK